MKTIKAKVHRLPTEEGCIAFEKDYGFKFIGTTKEGYYKTENQQPQHLYITTDEIPKKGEYGYNTLEKIVSKIEVDDINHTWRKIISTTDTKIFTSETDEVGIKSKFDLPQIPQSFIEEYCKAGGIDEVLVEYVLNPTRHTHLKPRTINNTIIIHPVEEKMYSREEVKLLVTMALQWNGKLTVEFIDKWIEENL